MFLYIGAHDELTEYKETSISLTRWYDSITFDMHFFE